MTDFLVLSIARSVEGCQGEMLRWYGEQHIPDILKLEGFSKPRRFRMADVQLVPGQPQDQFVTLFDLSCDDPRHVATEVESRIALGEMKISEAVEDFRVLVLEQFEIHNEHS